MPPPRIALVNPIASQPPPVSATTAVSMLEEAPSTRVRVGAQEALRLARLRSASLVVMFSTLPLRSISLLLAMTAMHKGIPYAILPPNHPFRRTAISKLKISGAPVALSIVGSPDNPREDETKTTSSGDGILLRSSKDCVYTYKVNNSAESSVGRNKRQVKN